MKARRLRNYASFQELETPYKFLCDHFLGPNTNVRIEHHYCSNVILFVIHPSFVRVFAGITILLHGIQLFLSIELTLDLLCAWTNVLL